MKYRLGDICTITKGDTGIMKAIPGAYTMVALGEANKTHNEFQFDTKAVIIPLVSSTGHGHASMKRVKYQEGKFALGSILCAVIPKEEKVVLAKYLHIYLHWNREELLVSQMKGMANVSLPMNKIADVLVTVPSIEKQQEIIDLEVQLVEKELSVEKLLSDQLTQLENLNQAILQEAVQGKLVKQDLEEETASELLKRIKADKVKSGKKEKPLPPIKPEEIPFEIPENWVWCRLGEIVSLIVDGSHNPPPNKKIGIPMLSSQNILNNEISLNKISRYISEAEYQIELRRINIEIDDVLLSTVGSIGRCAVVEKFNSPYTIQRSIAAIKTFIFPKYLMYVIHSPNLQKQIIDEAWGVAVKGLYLGRINNLIIPLPPLSEQKRIVAEIEKQLAKTKQLKEHIIANQQATKQLLKALLHQAFEVDNANDESVQHHGKVVEFRPRKCTLPEKTILAGRIIKLTNGEEFGRVKFQKLLYLTEHVCKLDLESNYVQKVAGPYDEKLLNEIETTLKRFQYYSIKRSDAENQMIRYTALGYSTELDSHFENSFVEEADRINSFLLKFKNSTWEQSEIVATLYAVWNNRIIKNEIVADDLLKQDFLLWDKQKAKYRNRLNGALEWMRTNNVIPDGYGKIIGKPM